ncbi:glutathione S-transferase family protein [Chamaesiphon sp. OTE_20_metabat_361]|uniref:glutathione S-transferase n=1 Tax=Chamaesiphon sp. OTE_20_metabat_361 TaxID=2964689 RepID=UPI00286C9C2D|nr:glutathione S-transferase family protein [Chamaesiphon sp. OTE_20_metabat_361]
MLELYQFELSHFSEKVRLVLDYKGLAYRKIEVMPGMGQLDLFRMSGQRQVPVLKDGNKIVADSTAIALYLDKTYPDRPIIPTNPQQKATCLLLEQWADDSIGVKGRSILLESLKSSSLRTSILPAGTPDIFKNLVGSIPTEAIDLLGLGVGLTPDSIKAAKAEMHRSLESICMLLAQNSCAYLIGDTPTLADLTVAGLSLLLKIPTGPYLNVPFNLKGKGIPGFADNPDYDIFFTWRDKLYADFRNPHIPDIRNNSGAAPTTPTTIAID